MPGQMLGHQHGGKCLGPSHLGAVQALGDLVRRYPSTAVIPLAVMALLIGLSVWGVTEVASRDLDSRKVRGACMPHGAMYCPSAGASASDFAAYIYLVTVCQACLLGLLRARAAVSASKTGARGHYPPLAHNCPPCHRTLLSLCRSSPSPWHGTSQYPSPASYLRLTAPS